MCGSHRNLLPILLLGTLTVNSAAAESLDYARDVRPILSNHCFRCHGPDDDTREADLRLDTQSGLQTVVDRDQPENSELLQRIHTRDPDLTMPPAASGKPLPDNSRQVLSRWIREGAAWSEHWSFVRPIRRAPPAAGDWARNEIDAFALRRMEEVGLQPSPEADPFTLVRRLYLDLTGLPPTPAEADQWIVRIWPDFDIHLEHESQKVAADESAWQLLVTHLLESPAWGERWARRWLDLARYADTNGYEKDRDRSIWPYRDWVINALNSGMPFDQFTIEQLAGDMLPNATESQRIATGFHRNTMLNEEGGIDPLEYRFHAMTDRVATTGTTWLGLTIGCAQCHTHKYDPISHREYYGLMALLNNADEPTLQLEDAGLTERNAQRQHKANMLQAMLPDEWPKSEDDPDGNSLQHEFDAWLTREADRAVSWNTLYPDSVRSSLPLLTVEDDGIIFASGDTAKRDDYWIAYAGHSKVITSLQLEVLPDKRLPDGGPGTTYYEGTIGDFFLNELVVRADGELIPITSASESYAKDRFGKHSGATLCIDGDVQTGWSVHNRIGERQVAVFQLARPLPPHTEFELQLTFGRHFASSLGKFRFSAASDGVHPVATTHSQQLQAILVQPAASRSDVDNNKLLTAFLMQAPQLKSQADKIRKLQQPLKPKTTLVMQERPSGNIRPTHVHHRGEFLQPKDRVKGGTPAVLHAMPSTPNGSRLALAEWIVDPANPLTGRVIVNRHWAAIFGTGIVRTVDDFGLQGEFPSHPDLLDWLAMTFVEDDAWSLRKLHRRIVSSSLYRQSAVVPADAVQRDPQNRLLSHSPRFRLDAELLRDRLLVAAGVYHAQIGGPSVFPPQPASAQDAAYRKTKWRAAEGEQRYRRSLYTFARRTAPFAMLTTFDAPTGESCVARRNRSNNPLQALTLLNDLMFTELARHAGTATFKQSASEEQRIVDLFRRILTRPPQTAELQSLTAYVSDLRRSLAADPGRARELSAANEEQDAEAAVELSVWTALARALFALDETVMRE